MTPGGPLLIVFLLIHEVIADYSIGYTVDSFEHPSNILFNNVCCVGGDNSSQCEGECSLIFNVCFMEPRSDLSLLAQTSDLEDCDYRKDNSTVGTTTVFEQYYRGSPLLDVRIFNKTGTSGSSLPGSLIDNFVIKANVSASLNKEPNVQGVKFVGRGELAPDSNLTVTLTVHCEENFFGSGCERRCRKDGTHCRLVYIGPVIYRGYNIDVADSLVIAAVLLMVLTVVVCCTMDQICIWRREHTVKKRTHVH